MRQSACYPSCHAISVPVSGRGTGGHSRSLRGGAANRGLKGPDASGVGAERPALGLDVDGAEVDELADRGLLAAPAPIARRLDGASVCS